MVFRRAASQPLLNGELGLGCQKLHSIRESSSVCKLRADDARVGCAAEPVAGTGPFKMNFEFSNLLGAPYRGGNLLLTSSELLSPVGNRVSQVYMVARFGMDIVLSWVH